MTEFDGLLTQNLMGARRADRHPDILATMDKSSTGTDAIVVLGKVSVAFFPCSLS